jgi:hypothetical protein
MGDGEGPVSLEQGEKKRINLIMLDGLWVGESTERGN